MGHGGHQCPEVSADEDDTDEWDDPDLWTSQDTPPDDVDRAPQEFDLGRSYTTFTKSGKSTAKEYTITVVDRSGVYEFPVVWCTCKATPRHEQLFDMRLYPASQTTPKTAFTFDVLDDFLIANFESKEPAHSYYRRLVRHSNEAFPDSVPVSGTCM